MAKRVTPKSSKKKTGKGKGQKKTNIFARIGNFFKNLSKEIKKVIWPDRLKLKRAATVTLTIIVAVALLIFVTDTILQGVLKAAGFDKPNVTPPTEAVAESAEESEADSDVSETNDGAAKDGDSATDETEANEADSAEATDESEANAES